MNLELLLLAIAAEADDDIAACPAGSAEHSAVTPNLTTITDFV
jgi:hypothetical protein